MQFCFLLDWFPESPLTLSSSATLRNVFSSSCATFTSPLYMKSRTSLRLLSLTPGGNKVPWLRMFQVYARCHRKVHNAQCTVHTFQVEKWVGVRISLQDGSEERRAGGNYHLSLELRICDENHFKHLDGFEKLNQNWITL